MMIVFLFGFFVQAYYRHVGMEFLGIPAYDTITFNLSRYFYEAACFIDEALRSGGTQFQEIYRHFCFLINSIVIIRNCTGSLSRGNIPQRYNRRRISHDQTRYDGTGSHQSHQVRLFQNLLVLSIFPILFRGVGRVGRPWISK